MYFFFFCLDFYVYNNEVGYDDLLLGSRQSQWTLIWRFYLYVSVSFASAPTGSALVSIASAAVSSPVFPPGDFYGLIATFSVAFDALAISTFTFISAKCPDSVCMRYPGALNTAYLYRWFARDVTGPGNEYCLPNLDFLLCFNCSLWWRN